jgi:hypothetical protein
VGRNQAAGISKSCREARFSFYFDTAIWLKLFAGISFLHGNIPSILFIPWSLVP